MSQEIQSDSDLPSGGPYEFDAEQNELIAELSRGMTIVGVYLAAVAVLYALMLISAAFLVARGEKQWVELIAVGLPVIVSALVGGWTYRASRSFEEITKTRGKDIELLMSALNTLKRMYSLLSSIILAVIALTLAFLTLGFVASMGR